MAWGAGVYRFLQMAVGLYLCFIGWSTWRHAGDPLVRTRAVQVSTLTGFRKGLLLGCGAAGDSVQ